MRYGYGGDREWIVGCEVGNVGRSRAAAARLQDAGRACGQMRL